MKRSKLKRSLLIIGLLLLFNVTAIMAQWNGCLQFNREEHDKVTVYNTKNLWPGYLPTGTVEFWMKPDYVIKSDTHDPDYTYVFCKNISGNQVGDFGICWERGEGHLTGFIQSGTSDIPTQKAESDNSAFDARWYHVAFVWDVNDTMRMFIDGVQQAKIEPDAEGETCLGIDNGDQYINIGSGAQDVWYSKLETFPGCIDEVRFSYGARYTSDFKIPDEPFEVDDSTMALWHFDEGDGYTAYDATGYGWDGYLGDVDSAQGFAAPQWVKVERDQRIVVNEILADPAEDANGDGSINNLEDEFIELVNIYNSEMDLTGWKVGDESVNFQFPDGYKLQPNEFVVIFGGGDVSNVPGYSSNELETKVFTAGGSIGDGLNEEGDYVVVQSENALDDGYVAFGTKATAGAPTVSGVTNWTFEETTSANANNDNSITRSPDANLATDAFDQHKNVGSTNFSPGQTINGYDVLSYSLTVNVLGGGGSVTIEPEKEIYVYGDQVTLTAIPEASNVFEGWSGDAESGSYEITISMTEPKTLEASFIDAFQLPVTVLINEINADPSQDPVKGDANLDGDLSTSDDEFVELVNVSNETIDLSGWMLGDDEQLSFTFPEGVTMEPGEFITVFGGGNISGVPGYNPYPPHSKVFVSDSTTLGNQIANSSESVILLSPDTSYAMYCNYGGRFQAGPPNSGFCADIYFNMRIEADADAGSNTSITRYPDGWDGRNVAPYVQHITVNEDKEQSANTDINGNTKITPNSVDDEKVTIARDFKLFQNYPNPFNPTTTIKFFTPKKAVVKLSVHNIRGELVKQLTNQEYNTGSYFVQWNGTNAAGVMMPTGIYVYTVEVENMKITNKMLLIK